MKADIPDHDLKDPEHGPPSEEHERRLLDAEAKWRENLNREADQRHSHRFWVFILSIAIAGFIIFLVVIVVCGLLFSSNLQLPASVQLAAYVAPIASTTVIAIALLFGTFRGYGDRDDKAAASGLSEILRGSAGAG